MTVKRRPLRPPEIRSAPTRPDPIITASETRPRTGQASGRPVLAAGRHVMATTAPAGHTGPVKPSLDTACAGFITYLVSVATGVEADQIQAPTRQSAGAARARQIAMYLAHVGLCWPMERVGAAFGRDRSTASHACHRVEDLRDQPAFDAALETLEACIRAVPVNRAARL